MVKASVLVVDDDPHIRQLVSVNLRYREYEVDEAPDGATAISKMEQTVPDLVIVDLVMPGVSGTQVCEWIRGHDLDTPIMVLSAYGEEQLKVGALDAGADDYVTKPFGADEFLARVRALMRRAGVSESPVDDAKVKIDGLTIDIKGRRAFVDDTDLHLTRTEFALLAALVENCDAVITHDELLAKVWGEEYRGSSHYLHVYLGRIRKKLGPTYEPFLETIAGMGYLFHSHRPE